MYDYLEAMVTDVMDYVTDDVELNDFLDREELEQHLNDVLFIEDCVTGNTSGSYTFSSNQAKEYVLDNIYLLNDAIYEGFLDSDTVGEKFLEEDWEYFDVNIRCFMLGKAISDALDELETDGKLVFDDDVE